MRRGEDYIAGLRDGRAVYLGAERIKDVTTHPAFAAPIQQIARAYDLAADPAHGDATTYVDEAGRRWPSMWLIPRSAQDLAIRRRGHRFWAERSFGLMGRTPDCVAGVLTGFAAAPSVFARAGARYAENVVRFHERARKEDLYVSYAVNPPHVDRSKPAHQQREPFLYAGAVRERDDGIVVRGALMIATSAILADYVLATYLVPLQKGDEDYAISVVMPCGADGLRLYPRRPYGATEMDVRDYPLSARFDESDALLVLNDVFVPWENVFVYRDVDLISAQWHQTPAHGLSNFQALVRYCVKLDFAAGLAIKLAELHNTVSAPAVQAQLGHEVATICASVQAFAHAVETQPVLRDGVAWPNPQFLYASQSYQQQTATELLRALRTLAGGAFISVPSSHAVLHAPETEADAQRYYRSVAAGADDRIKLLNLMWDFVGTEFGGRQLQYELFYSAGPHVVDTRAFRTFDWDRGRRLVDRCLGEY
jgi:4-hydroxyphenylacetate 3-monooxygenase